MCNVQMCEAFSLMALWSACSSNSIRLEEQLCIKEEPTEEFELEFFGDIDA